MLYLNIQLNIYCLVNTSSVYSQYQYLELMCCDVLACAVFFLAGGKWWTGGEQNEFTCTSLLKTSGSEGCFHEGI